ncbi:hypothetical protein FQR65_LT01580 [Abscondita terminalis]|nr:hypothetical protein FQR65_LT01580 [Abscondita terminalis]
MFHNQIATLSINHFNNLSKKGKPNTKEWTVLSCIVKENTATKHFEVVALGTGSKCIGKSKMSSKGDVVNDSHAEVICRRAFIRYLYEELNFKRTDLFLSNNVLNEFVRFHFFTTHMPCGDAAIFAKQDPVEFGDVLACLSECNLQDLRTPGSEYHTLGAVRTKPGRGDPTLSVSCSDKLARWCQIGLQGALLARIIKAPIYLSSITVCAETPFNEESLRRALFTRLGVCRDAMVIGQASVVFDYSKSVSKLPCPSSIIWSKFASHEVAVDGIKQGVTKKNRGTTAARLCICKVELFRKFLTTLEDTSTVFYDEAKSQAVDYQRAWLTLKKEGFKCWTIKDKNLQHFTVE